MPEQIELALLLQWCCETGKDTRTSLVEDTDWGFCARNPARPGYWFVWFDTPEDLFAYFANCWGYDYHQPAHALQNDLTLTLKTTRYGEYVRQYLTEECSEDTFLARLSDAYPHLDLLWIGPLEEILDGDTSFAREWRAEFRALDITEGDYPIEDHEIDHVLQVMEWPVRHEQRLRD